MRDAKIPFYYYLLYVFIFTNKTSEIHDDNKFPPYFPTIYVKIINIYEIEIVVENTKIFSIYKQMLFDNKKPPLHF